MATPSTGVPASVTHPSAADIRKSLASRSVDEFPPGAWRTTVAGESGADSFLCNLSRSIAAAIGALAALAENARFRLNSTRTDLHSEYNLRCAALEAEIDAEESTKVSALEREACVVDGVLERWRAERSAVTGAAVSLGDVEIVAQLAELTARLDAADAELLALPTTVVEPPYIGLVVEDSPALHADAGPLWRVVSPLAITAADMSVRVDGAPSCTWPGDVVRLRLELISTHHASQTVEEVEVSLNAAAAETQVEAWVDIAGEAPQPLRATFNIDLRARCVVASFSVPKVVTVDASVRFCRLTLAGQPVRGTLGALLIVPACPADLSRELAAQLQAWLPPGGSISPAMWEEVYRGTTDGFGAADFHARCDGLARLLVLVLTREGGWLFGGFTAVGFDGPPGYIADSAAFLFSLINSLGHPEKLTSKGTGGDLLYAPTYSASFGDGNGLAICGDADKNRGSNTNTGKAYELSASAEAHPMAQGHQWGWTAAEVVAWIV